MAVFLGKLPGCIWGHAAQSFTDPEWDEYIEFMRENLLSPTSVPALVVTINVLGATPTAGQRRRLAIVMKKHHDLVMKNTLANAFISDSAITRGALTALRWVTFRMSTERVFSSLSRARSFMEKVQPQLDYDALVATLKSRVPPELLPANILG